MPSNQEHEVAIGDLIRIRQEWTCEEHPAARETVIVFYAPGTKTWVANSVCEMCAKKWFAHAIAVEAQPQEEASG